MNFSLFFSIISAIAAVVSIVGGILSYKNNQFKAVNEFMSKIEDENFIEIKHYIYNNKNFSVVDKNSAILVNFFHHWGLLVKKRYLPLWVFDKATGRGACRLYEKVEPYIKKRREFNNDSSYGEYYEWLYYKLKKRYK
ncbi:MAG: hypothetical protein U0L58_02130 [Ruminococcus sp.]|nr:hypothetical protein [Ruminococcus sp.]